MYIESLELKNFRNYDSLKVDFSSGTNIFYGDNAQGKTNVLEAVYLCGTTKSHRGSKDREIIRFEEDESHIRMNIKKDGISYKIDMHLKKNKAKGIAVNGVPIKKARELLGIVNLVFFSPEDLNIIKNSPGERRRFIDLELCQLDPIYLTDLTSYNHILNQRNRLLRDLHLDSGLEDTLDVWDMQMAKYGSGIIEKRRNFVSELNSVINKIHRNLTGETEDIKVVYKPSVKSSDLEKTLQLNREKDIRTKMTNYGPHRDDLCFLANNIDIRRYGSQGQQRTAALSLKLSEISLVKKKIRDTPILLLDDVLSELDGNRQTYLLKEIHDIQTMITCTGLDDFISHQFKINRVFQVVNGHIYLPYKS